MKKWRASSLLAATVMLVGVATACQPAPPVPLLTVTVPVAGGDTNPGDGICEATLSGTQCTLQAAIQEANALGRADIVMPGGREYAAINERITGTVAIRVTPANGERMAWIRSLDLTIERGATLALTDVSMRGDTNSYGTTNVKGNLVVERMYGGSWGSSVVHVFPTGRAILQNTHLTGVHAGIVNEGWVELRYSYVMGSESAIVTASGGDTRMAAAAVLADKYTPAATGCTGARPTSLGYNAATDTTCQLDQTGDMESLPFGALASVGGDSPVYDAIPFGAVGCGTTTITDISGWPRPHPYGASACNIGPIEAG